MRGVKGSLSSASWRESCDPVEVVECMASLDVIWRGNFVFVGLGYRDVEFDAFKVPKQQRVRRFE